MVIDNGRRRDSLSISDTHTPTFRMSMYMILRSDEGVCSLWEMLPFAAWC